MKQRIRPFLFACFFLSGFSSLLYQIIWLRLAFARFGVITPILSAVVSVFMLGLLLGSWAAGQWEKKWQQQLDCNALQLYGLAEILTGLGAFAVPSLFGIGQALLLQNSSTDSSHYFAFSSFCITLALLPACLCMGATFPLALSFLRERYPAKDEGFSFLYLANLLGALSGVAVTAWVLIEIYGFSHCLNLGVGLNLSIGVAAMLFPGRFATLDAPAATEIQPARPNAGAAYPILFLSGFISMALEVIWTRAYCPILGTQVYAFAGILFSYLLANAIGSWSYRFLMARAVTPSLSTSLACLGVSALLPLLGGDPRPHLGPWICLICLLPISFFFGLLTPQLLDRLSGGEPAKAGRAYALNVLGCVFGPLLATYLLLPGLGVKYATLLLATPFLFLSPLYAKKKGAAPYGLGALAFVALFCASFSMTYEEPLPYEHLRELRRDATATVISFFDGHSKRLIVNGINITNVSSITKIMAHLPLAALGHPPQSALDICFGMGTTFRSLSSWGIPATAVELVPSVPKAFPYYFDDAAAVLGKPSNRVVIDDGRRYLERCGQSFDVITIDPPPPMGAAASSLLYSREFYALAKAHLKPGGILAQWVPANAASAPEDHSSLEAMTQAILQSFPYVRVFGSTENWGLHYLCSDTPLKNINAASIVAAMPESAKKDLMEWNPAASPRALFDIIFSREVDPRIMVARPSFTVEDDRPLNEYDWLRTQFPAWVAD